MTETTNETARCGRCGHTFTVPKERYGHLVRCPGCHRIIPGVNEQPGPPITRPGVLARGIEVSDGGQFNIPIKGESHYLPAIEGLNAGRRGLGREVEFEVYLMRDHENAFDPNATAVFAIDRGQIGYLSREDAERYLEAMAALERVRRFPGCRAKLIGGTRSKPNLGVLLDLPRPDALLVVARELAAAGKPPD